MATVTGRLVLTRFSGGDVQMVFIPHSGAGNSKPLLAKRGQAEDDLVNTFSFAPQRAAEIMAEVDSTGQADVVISIDEGLAASLARPR